MHLSEKKHIPLPTPPQPRINLVYHCMTRIGRPINTSLLNTSGQNPLLQKRRLLNRINIQARTDMPRDMAMERPDARIIREILQHDITRRARRATLDELHVAPLGIGLVGDCSVPGTDALGQDVEVVAVEMHGVGGWELVFDDDADGAVGAEVIDVPLGVEGVREVALVGEDEDGVTLK